MAEPASKKAPEGRADESWLHRIVDLGLRRPLVTVVLGLLVAAACAAFSYELPISTSRYKLIDDSNPYQARTLRFFERFGYPDAMVFVVEGKTQTARRQAVDRLVDGLQADPAFEGRVLGRIRIEEVSELLLLFRPEALDEMRRELDREPAELIEGGIEAWLGAITDKFEAGLSDDEDADEDATPPPTEAEQDKAFRNLAKLLAALEAHLAGEDALRAMPQLDDVSFGQKGSIDDEGYVVSDDGNRHFVAVFPDLPGAEGYQVKPVVERLRTIRDEVAAGLPPESGVSMGMTGLPALVADELVVLERGLRQTSVGTGAAIFLLLFIAFRSFRYSLLALLPLGLGVILTLASARGIFGGLNLVTSSFVPVLLALGIDFGVYVLSRYGEQVRQGAPPRVALREGITKAGPGMLVGASTTMMAFLMTGVIEFTAYSELGVITASGLALMVAVTFLLLPPLIFLAGKGKTISSPELKGMARVPDLIRKGAVPLLASGVVLIGLGASTFGGLRFNARYFDFLPETTESAKALFAIEDDEQVTPVQSSSSTESLEEARRLADDLRALDSVGAVHTPSDLVPALTPKRLEALRAGFADTRAPNFDKLRDGSRTVAGLGTALTDLIDIVDEVAGGMRSTKRDTAAIDQVKTAARSLQKRIDELGDSGPTRLKDAETRLAGFLEPAWRTAQRVAAQGKVQASDLPGVFQARFVARDGKGLAVYATPRGDIWKEENAKRFAREVQSVDAEASGLAVTIHEHMRMIKDGFRKASLFTIAGVILILLISFRRLDDALVAMTPVVIGISIMLGFMGSRGIPFDVANVVSLPLIVGVGIDAGAHMVHRWRLSAVENGGVGSLDELMRGTGAAVLMASLTTAIGFAALVFADYGGMRSLGVTMTVGVLGCLFSAVLVLPAGLVVWGKVR